MGFNLSHHDINWVYSYQNGKDMGYYLRTRIPFVRLISCLPESNRGMDEDFLIVSGDWHNGLHCPTQNGEPGTMTLGLKIKHFTLSS